MEKKIEKLKTEMSETYGERLAFDHWEELEYSVIDEIGLKLNEIIDYLNSQEQELDKAREEGRRKVYEAVVFDENIPHDITTFVAANLWKNMRDKAREELSKLRDNK